MDDQMATLKATIDLRPKTDFLTVAGSVMIYTSDFDIDVAEAVPQGTNDRELILDVTVTERPSPMKGVMQPFDYRKMVHGPDYDTIRARFSHGVEEVVATVTVIPEG